MSIIFGVFERRQTTLGTSLMSVLAAATDRFAQEGTFVKACGDIEMGFQPFHTHERSRMEAQPAVDRSGNMLVFDGRLDNKDELCRSLTTRTPDASDSSIAIAAFKGWGERCFSHFVGDWALALWSSAERSLYLARDHAGARTLYYQANESSIRWSTSLDTLVCASPALELDEEFVADHLAIRANFEATPYRNIKAVAPAHYVVFRPNGMTCKPHWQWICRDKLCYRTDAEYEEHFLANFRTAVKRRIGPGAPIVAQLSGGMDSSSIVCMADHISHDETAQAAQSVRTISVFDDSEPHWNEKPYFSAVESRRGQIGIHVDNAAYPRSWSPSGTLEAAYLLPGMDQEALKRERDLQTLLSDTGYRVILSGLGGDELLGGVPTPLPALADAFAAGQWKAFWQQSLQWCLVDRSPIMLLLLRGMRQVGSCYLVGNHSRVHRYPWLRTNQTPSASGVPAELGLIQRLSFPPSSICCEEAWWSVLANLPSSFPDYLVRYEYRYPFLDRDLATFLFQVPREQLVRPGQRRSLMKRALRNIVPPEVLQRRRKAYLIRNATLTLEAISQSISADELRSLSVVQRGFVDPKALSDALARVGKGQNLEWVSPLWRTLLFDLWLRSFDEGSAQFQTGIEDPLRAPCNRGRTTVEI